MAMEDEDIDQIISVKLIVNKETKRLVFAECNKDFVDVLLSFLTMPIGTVVRLCNKNSKLGCMDSLYESVEALDDHLHFQTPECKNMLVRPATASRDACQSLAVKIDDDAAGSNRQYYTCVTGWERCMYMSTLCNALCGYCGKPMNRALNEQVENRADGRKREGSGFVKGITSYMITDGLQVFPSSLETIWSLLQSFNIGSSSQLEERQIKLGAQEVLTLLKQILVSETPFTDVFLGEQGNNRIKKKVDYSKYATELKGTVQSQKTSNIQAQSMTVTLFVDKIMERVVAAEAGEEFSELLLNFLTFPLGLIAKCLDGTTKIGSLDNLYKSVHELEFQNYMNSEVTQFLIEPRLPCYYKSCHQLLEVKAKLSMSKCFNRKTYREVDPKNLSPPSDYKEDTAFMKGPSKFVMTDDLVVRPSSYASTMFLFSGLFQATSDIELRTVTVGKAEAMALLRASFTSTSVLNNTFFSKDS